MQNGFSLRIMPDSGTKSGIYRKPASITTISADLPRCARLRDFVTGEMRYFAKDIHEPGGHLLEMPREWMCKGNWDRRLARSLLRIAMQDILAPSLRRLQHPLALLRAPVRWLMPAIADEKPALVRAAVKVGLARVALNLASLAGSKAVLGAAFKNHVAALIDHQRLVCLKSQRKAST